MNFEFADRFKKLPKYLFVELDKKKKRILEEGKDLIDLGVGDPDIKCPDSLIKIICTESQKKENQTYSLERGLRILREKIAIYMKKRFNVDLDPESEILVLIGSKEGIVHFPLSILNRGDLTLIPNPCYPPYRSSVIFCEADYIDLPLTIENEFLPQLDRVPKDILEKAKLLFLNYPNNPTTALASESFLKKVIEVAKTFGFVIVNDCAYSELYFEEKPLSLLQIEGAKEVCIEFHSFSKTFCMTGFRLGWACGNRDLISALLKVKSHIDSGVFNPIQIGGAHLLENELRFIERVREIYRKRRDLFCKGLKEIGLEFFWPKATFYVWAKIPKNMDSFKFAEFLIEECNILATPGIGFGMYGEGYVRFSLTKKEEILEEAIERLRKKL